MRKPKQFGRVITWTFGVSILLQCIFSVTNGMYYGKDTAQVIVIDMHDHFELGITSACFIGISILSHFSLPTLVVMESLDYSLIKTSACCSSSQQAFNTFLMVLLRVGIVALCLGLALLLPYFAYLMGFIGSTVTLTMCMILPCSFHLKLRYKFLKWYQILVDVFIIICSLICFGAGSYFSFESIYYDWVNDSYIWIFNELYLKMLNCDNFRRRSKLWTEFTPSTKKHLTIFVKFALISLFELFS